MAPLDSVRLRSRARPKARTARAALMALPGARSEARTARKRCARIRLSLSPAQGALGSPSRPQAWLPNAWR
eukprot:8118973-Alexandrium_andersonii.AAC.1